MRIRSVQTGIEIAGIRAEVLAVSLGPHTFHLAIPEDADEVLQRDADPYWAALWPSALALAAYLVERFPCAGKRMLELGCGVGLVGVVAARLGGQVVLTDYNPEALAFARHNLRLNRCEGAAVRFLDWHAPAFEGQFDVLLAADVIYDPANWEALLALWPRLLKPGGEVLLAEPGRPSAPSFLERTAQRGWTWCEHGRDVRFRGQVHRVGIYTIATYRTR